VNPRTSDHEPMTPSVAAPGDTKPGDATEPTTHLSKYRGTCTAQVRSMGFMHATHEHVFGLASMVDFGQATQHTRSRKSDKS